jgi:DNA-binding winged helix-turn-helix (wHTH) protein
LGFGTRCERIAFDRFILSTRKRLLPREGVPVPIGVRAFNIPVSLVVRRGALVSTDDLPGEVWPSPCFAPHNLRVQLVALRKTLGDRDARLIATDAVDAGVTSDVPPLYARDSRQRAAVQFKSSNHAR